MTMSRVLTSSNLATGAMSATASTSGSANLDNVDGNRKDKVVLHYALFLKRPVRSTKDRSHHRRMQEDRADSHSTLDTEDPSSSLHDEALLVDLRECSNNTTNRNDQSWSRMFANPNDIFGKMPIPIKPTVSKDDDSSSRWAYMTAPEYEQSSVRSGAGAGAVPLTSSLLPQPPAVARPLMMDIPWMAPSQEDDRGDGGDGAENNINNNDNTKSSDQVPLLRLAMSSSSSVSPSPPRQAPPSFAVVQHQQPNQTYTAVPCTPPTPPRSVHWLLLVWKQSKTLWCWRRQTSIGGTHRHRHYRRSTSTLPPPTVATPPVITIPLELQMEALVKGEIDGFVLQFPCSADPAATTRIQTDSVSTSLGKIELDCCSTLTEPKYY